MGVVFDEIVTEVSAPSTEGAEHPDQQSSEELSSPQLTDVEMRRAIERIERRLLRLIAD